MPALSADVLQETHEWGAGDAVRVRGEPWKVEAGQRFADCEVVRLLGTGRANRGRRVALLWPFDRPERLGANRRVRRVRLRRWLHALRAVAADATPYGCLRRAAEARLDLRAWQLEPALALFNGLATRVLLADEVGLGKTIQAGLVVAELLALVPIARVLILAPAGLCDQWEEELRARFRIQAAVVDGALLRRTVTQVAAGINPWSTWPVIVASLDFVKRAEVLRGLAPFTWDLLVVDEAHGCALAPERSAAVRALARRSRRVVLATATPHAGDEHAFSSLCDTGALAADEAPIVMFRRCRADVGIESGRRVHLLRVRCTSDELAMHRVLARYTLAVWRTPATADARLAMLVLRKRALSSAASLVRSLERRALVLFDLPAPGTQLALPFAGLASAEEETTEDAEPLGALAAPGLDDARRERTMLVGLMEAARVAARSESKLARLSRFLRRAREPAIVFTEYRDTARSVALALEPLGGVVTLHGALCRAERREVAREFTAGSARVLVATDAAGEGLNLHQRCRLVVNLELPWNPLRLEQRIGRVDRLGQHRRPHALHLVARETAEERVVERLVLRQESARRSLGAVPDAVGLHGRLRSCALVEESTVMDRVMEDDAGEPVAGWRDERASRGSAQASYRTVRVEGTALGECRRLEELRRVLDGFTPDLAAAAIDGTLVSTLSRARAHKDCRGGTLLRPGLLAVFVARIVNQHGDVIEQLPCCLRVPGATARDMARLLEAANEFTAAIAKDRVAVVSALRQRVVGEIAARERRLVQAAPEPRAAVQPGMFDLRAIKATDLAKEERAARERDRISGLSAYDTDSGQLLVASSDLALVLVLPA